MGRYKRGDIVLVPFPFVSIGEGEKRKLRPALVISVPEHRRYPDVSLLAITSKIPDRPTAGEIVLTIEDEHFKETGLAAASTFRAEFVMTVPESLIHRSIGHTPPKLLTRIEQAIKISLGLNS